MALHYIWWEIYSSKDRKVWKSTSLLLLTGPLSLSVVLPVKIPPMDQMDMFKIIRIR